MGISTPLIVTCKYSLIVTWLIYAAFEGRESVQDINIATSFFSLNSIEINPKNTELLVINPSTDDLNVTLGNDIIEALDPATAARMLGVWFAADGKTGFTRMCHWSSMSNSFSNKVLAQIALWTDIKSYPWESIGSPKK
ncbi:hypothetical protein BGX27_004017 [Mortierella sp. AM989]|nr:hypothetical protein BGX27_004017 [Mortierella sp. AM989]